MSNFLSEVSNTIVKNNMLSKGDKVIVALSGGADSVSLFYSLLSIRDKLGFTLAAAHVNHNLRGEEALRDENFVRKITDENNVELYFKSVDVAKIAREQKISTELCGRNVRYEFFEELYREHKAKIATAHTASDNGETILFNLIRGTGLKGMRGIVSKRAYIIRPLIGVTRSQVEEYCRENSLDYVTDSTNLNDDYTRNIIRHKLIPVIKEINPNFEQAALRESSVFADLYSYIDVETNKAIEQAKTANGYDSKYLDSLDKGLKSSVIAKLAADYGASVESCHIESIKNLLSGDGSVDMPPSVRAVSKQGTLRFINNNSCKEKFIEKPLKVNLDFTYNNTNYSIKELNSGNSKELIDLCYLDKTPVFRTRRSGDTFTFQDRNVTKSLKKLLNELKIPEENRDSIMLLAVDNTVLWLEGVGVSKQGKSKTNKGIKIFVDKRK